MKRKQSVRLSVIRFPRHIFSQISKFVEIRDSTYMEKVTDLGLDVSMGFSF
jgi:hypothetical protein